MEEEGIMDVDNELDILALHLVFLERMQDSLSKFRLAVSRRPLRTEGNKTPLQLWILGQTLDPRVDLTTAVCIIALMFYNCSPHSLLNYCPLIYINLSNSICVCLLSI